MNKTDIPAPAKDVLVRLLKGNDFWTKSCMSCIVKIYSKILR